ncbi:MAG TPA: YoaK family protein [Trebonia sp.]|nr:YoaK family protein [Trebonia sp.]
MLAIAMGIQNSAARKLAVPDLSTTVLTMTLTGIGADLRSGRRGNLTLARRLLAVAIMLGGGVLGAWLVLQVSATAAVAVAAGLLLAAAACAALAARTPAPWRPAGPAPARSAVASPGLPSAGAVE